MGASMEFINPDLVAIYDAVNPIDDKTAFFVGLADKVRADKIIDFGCGTGLLSHELAKSGHQVIGVEPAARMVEQARQKYGDTIRWVVGGYEELDAAMRADMTIMTGHVAQFFLEDDAWGKTLSATYKATKPGGCLVFESRNPLIRPFASWPDSTNHDKIAHTPLGSVEWWAEKLVYADGYATYELHYLFNETGKEIVSANKLRFRTYEELQGSLKDAGFTVDTIYGNWSGDPLETHSPEMIFIASRS